MQKSIAVVAVLVCFLLGCGSNTTSKSEAISINEVPQKLLNIAKEKLPGVTFDQAVKKSNGVLEVRGKDKSGKVRDIEFDQSGTVVEIE